MSDFTSTPTRVPAALWESLQEICWAQDNAFLRDASRILGVPELELRRRVLGARGVVSAVVSTNEPWFLGSCCPLMIACPGQLWRRCSEPAEVNGFCATHKKGKGLRYDDPFFAGLPRRYPFRYEGALVMVGEDGSVLSAGGVLIEGVRIDLESGVCYDDRPVGPAWTRAEHDAAGEGDS